MMSIIDKIYNGDYYPAEEIKPDSDSFRKHSSTVQALSTQLKSILSKEQFSTADEYEIYQLKPECTLLKYMSLDWVLSHGYVVDSSNYTRVFSSTLGKTESLEDLYRKLNQDIKPINYYARNLSVSDIILLKTSRNMTAYYCDRVGFVEVPEFLESDNERQKILDNPISV